MLDQTIKIVLKSLSFQDIPVAHKHYRRLVIDLLLAKSYVAKERMLEDHIEILSGEDLIFLLNMFRSETGEGVNKFRVLNTLITILCSQYGAIFTFGYSDLVSALIFENERKRILGILTTSTYPSIKLDFEADAIRRRIWEEKLYYEFFEGHVVSIELLCNAFNKNIFYENLKLLGHFSKLKHINLLFFCNYNFYEVEDLLLDIELKSLEKVKIYTFSQNISVPTLKTLL